MGNRFREREPCNYWHPSGYCGDPATRRYLNGWFCPEHAPARLAGHKEVVPPDYGLKPIVGGQVRQTDLGEVYRQNRRARIDGKRGG